MSDVCDFTLYVCGGGGPRSVRSTQPGPDLLDLSLLLLTPHFSLPTSHLSLLTSHFSLSYHALLLGDPHRRLRLLRPLGRAGRRVGGRHGAPGAQDPDSARDDEPARSDRGRDRHRQDQDPSAPGGAAVGGGRAGLRRGHQGRPVGHRGAGRGERSRHRPGQGRGLRLGPEGRSHRVREPDRQAGRAAARDGQLLRPAAPREGALAERDPGERARHGLQVLRRQGTSTARLRRICGRCSSF